LHQNLKSSLGITVKFPEQPKPKKANFSPLFQSPTLPFP
jgi:hypothetical protein